MYKNLLARILFFRSVGGGLGGSTGGGGSVSYRISQDVVSATCGCIIATASRCQKQGLEKSETEVAVLKEFNNCLQHIIQGCMQSRVKGEFSSKTC